MTQTKVKIGLINLIKIYKSNKTFFVYRLSEDKTRILDYILTDDLPRFRAKYNNQFRLIDDIRKQIENFKIIL